MQSRFFFFQSWFRTRLKNELTLVLLKHFILFVNLLLWGYGEDSEEQHLKMCSFTVFTHKNEYLYKTSEEMITIT